MGLLDNIYKQEKVSAEELKKQALKDVKFIARILRDRFGAKEVILYGSLLKGRYFDMASDIDIVVKGLGDKYFKAYGDCLKLSRFSLDIRAYEDMPLHFRHKIDEQGRCLYARK